MKSEHYLNFKFGLTENFKFFLSKFYDFFSPRNEINAELSLQWASSG